MDIPGNAYVFHNSEKPSIPSLAMLTTVETMPQNPFKTRNLESTELHKFVLLVLQCRSILAWSLHHPSHLIFELPENGNDWEVAFG